MAEIYASILSLRKQDVERKLKKVLKKIKGVHIDIMDGKFVPNTTFFNPAFVNSLQLPLFKDVHLMVKSPEKHIKYYIAAGANAIGIHAESTRYALRIIKDIKKSNVNAALALNPETKIEKIKKYLPLVDEVLVMTVHPGFAGQKLIASVIPKIKKLKQIREKEKLNFRIKVDGGIKTSHIKMLEKAGADILVIGSALFEK